MNDSSYDATAFNIFYKREKKTVITGIQDIDQYISKSNQSSNVQQSFTHTGGVIELYGSSGTRKSETLLYILIQCLLPSYPPFNGNQIGVVYFDNDYKFDILLFRSLLFEKYKSLINDYNTTASMIDIDEEKFNVLYKDCCSRLFIVRCKDSFQFMVALRGMPEFIRNTSGSIKPNEKEPLEIRLIMIDSISAFYWVDQCGEGLNVKPKLIWLDPIRRLLTEFSMMIIATKQTIFSPVSSNNNNIVYNQQQDHDHPTTVNQNVIQHKEFLGLEWTKLVKYRKIM
ncbi:hypothetical protein CYY_000528 [Polysphondylium violaceum]|uniref:DNA recombination and repair protein Rad51-like C-terminal domain-containing protein n=1 Tax=Polysphondylium violaceum TaxID=133409 RepID=A0A8J4Q4L7_9MYCE|nr:hypothetical protein CYY_000528 [Polysphondylium violaceum]